MQIALDVCRCKKKPRGWLLRKKHVDGRKPAGGVKPIEKKEKKSGGMLTTLFASST
jgi:hypothetical protein